MASSFQSDDGSQSSREAPSNLSSQLQTINHSLNWRNTVTNPESALSRRRFQNSRANGSPNTSILGPKTQAYQLALLARNVLDGKGISDLVNQKKH